MSLTVCCTDDEHIAGEAVIALVRTGVRGGEAVVLVPSFDEALQVQKELADQGLGLGVSVATPRSWARDLWDLWGDGRRVVDTAQRMLLMREVLGDDAAPGTIRLMCQLAERCLPWVADAVDAPDADLTKAERAALARLGSYERILSEKGLVEGATVMVSLPSSLREAGVSVPQVVVAGFNALPRAERAFVARLSLVTEVTMLRPRQEGPAYELACLSAELVSQEARALGAKTALVDDEPRAPLKRAPELNELLGGLFGVDEGVVEPAGAVRLLEASGPLAEAELMAREVVRVANELDGSPAVAAVVPDVRRAWQELVPKLVNRGMTVRADLSTPVLSTQAGRAFMGYARTVAHLVALDATWPEPVEGKDGSLVRLGTMDWWPPKELTDFLLSGVACVEPHKARSLDLVWRGDRLLSPADVLAQLMSAKLTSDPVERATRELLRGRLGSAASKLLAPLVAAGAAQNRQDRVVELAEDESVQVLAAIMSAAGTLKELGITADPTVRDSVSLQQLVDQAELLLSSMSIRQKLEVPAQKGSPRATVTLCSRGQAASMTPGSVEVAMLCGLTSTEYAPGSNDDLLSGMLLALGIEPQVNALAAQRAQFHRLCSLPTCELLLERTLFSADSHETYPAVMLTELLAAYGERPSATGLAEDEARKNVSAAGVAPVPVEVETPTRAGNIDDGLRSLVVVPQEGMAELPGGLPVLSASQIESYLECPLKWFSLRRLRLGDNDAGFSPLEMGTFAHRVLELTYAQLFEEGCANLDESNQDGLAHAREVLDANFSLHLEHQYMRVGGRAAYQALIAHSSSEEGQTDRLRRDLLSTLDYVSCRLKGFEPRAFEWEFGRGKHTRTQPGLPSLPRARYAGVAVTGTVDRIDVNAQGKAVIIDYKHKGPAGFFSEYAAFDKDGAQEGAFELPRRIQSLMYAQVVQRAFPDLEVVGALYLGTRGTHVLSGAVDELFADAVFGGHLTKMGTKQVSVPRDNDFGQHDAHGMKALLAATEQAVAQKVERLRAGRIEADPVDANACSYCPVLNCERRMTR